MKFHGRSNIKILILEDDFSLGQTLYERLQKEGYTLHWARTCEESLTLLGKCSFDLLVLDLSLPDGSGFDVARQVLGNLDVPIIFMTALNTAENRLRGYEMGAVEFVPKPFHFKELLLRIEHVLENHIQELIIDFGDFTLNVEKMSVFFKTQDREEFPPARDFQVLYCVLSQAPKVISRDDILNQVWGEDKFPSNRTVDNTIVRLRDLLGSSMGGQIRSVRGVGYQWVSQIEGDKHVQ